MGMIDPRAIPPQVMIKSFLTAMAKIGYEVFVAFKQNGGKDGGYASNKESAEALARQMLAIQEGAVDVAAAAIHSWRMSPTDTSGVAAPSTVDDTRGLCSIVVCAGHELAQAKPVPWDDLPQEVKEAHRLVAKAVIAAAVAHKIPPPESKIIKPA